LKNGKEYILIVDDEESIRALLVSRFTKLNYEVVSVSSAIEARGLVNTSSAFDVIISDIKMPGLDGISFLAWLRDSGIHIPLILITGFADKDSAVSAVRSGAFDYIEKPFDVDELVRSVGSAFELVKTRREKEDNLKDLSRKVDALQRQAAKHEFVGSSDIAGAIRTMINKVAAYDSTVLITGPSGSGKEVVANLIHDKSSRGSKGAFIAVNCASIPSELLESELFGYEKGAFTGANIRKQGLFELAHHGTLFLDEVGDMEPALQAKVLRVIETRTFRRLGGKDEQDSDVRIISATNRDIKAMIEEDKFREDLYYRLNVVGINLPGLCERGNDILEITNYFIGQFRGTMKKNIKGIDAQVEKLFLSYPWPGNVRELKNVIERAFIMSDIDVIDISAISMDNFAASYTGSNHIDTKDNPESSFGGAFKKAKEDAISSFESNYLKAILKEHNGNVSEASLRAGIDRSNFLRLCRKHNIKAEEFRRQ
jgi:two-component system, NtrC family, response regulator AtoC